MGLVLRSVGGVAVTKRTRNLRSQVDGVEKNGGGKAELSGKWERSEEEGVEWLAGLKSTGVKRGEAPAAASAPLASACCSLGEKSSTCPSPFPTRFPCPPSSFTSPLQATCGKAQRAPTAAWTLASLLRIAASLPPIFRACPPPSAVALCKTHAGPSPCRRLQTCRAWTPLCDLHLALPSVLRSFACSSMPRVWPRGALPQSGASSDS